LLAAPKEFHNERLKRGLVGGVFGNYHARVPFIRFPAIFHQLTPSRPTGVRGLNPKKWENPEISTGCTRFRRTLLYS
jgi:hypothetical protein